VLISAFTGLFVGGRVDTRGKTEDRDEGGWGCLLPVSGSCRWWDHCL